MAEDRTDYKRLTSLLNRGNFQKDYPPIYQTLNSIIDGISKFQELVLSNFADTTFEESIQETLDSIRAITIRQVNTSVTPQSRALATYVKGATVFVDINGNAAVNNITLVGTVNGVVDPVINTNFGTFKVFRNSNGLFNQW